jgi:hypothetical protein|nr:hypothetical protein [Kofleriaceae bacterium]
MGKPYARVVIDIATGKAIDGTADDQPFRPVEPREPGQWLIVHDTRGRVVVRAFDPAGPYVVGTAKWYSDGAQQRAGLDDWSLVETTLRPRLASAPRAPADGLDRSVAPWVDDAPVDKRPATAAAASATTRPYVRVVVDTVELHAVDGSASITPLPLAPTNPHQWLVVHDTRGRVVVRAAHPSGPLVVGVAAWRDDRLCERAGLTATTPNDAQWEAIAAALRPLVAAASEQPCLAADPNAPPWVDLEPLHPDRTPDEPAAKPLGPPQRFELARNHWTLTSKWVIRDGAGRDAFTVHRSLVPPYPDRILFEDMAGAQLGYIDSGAVGVVEPGKVSEYSFQRRGGTVAGVSYNGGAPRRFSVLTNSEWLHIEGTLFFGDFALTRHKRPIVTVDAASLLADRYIVDVADGEDVVAMLAIVLMCELLFANT